MGKIKHRMSHSPAYRTWISMRRRCLAESHHMYPEYGARGITICDRWMEFANFYVDMGPRPDGHTIDRIDNDGNYEPGNCRWASAVVQMNNRRVTTMLTHNGETLSLAGWSKRTGIPRLTLAMRFHVGWSAERILETPYKRRRSPRKRSEIPPKRQNRKHVVTLGGRTQSAKAWADELGLQYHTIKRRIYAGWPAERVLTKVTKR